MKLINRFTSNYNKSHTGNLGKLMSIIDREFNELKTVMDKINRYRSIDNATGQTLDNIGQNVGQARGGMDDLLYRVYLKMRIRANLSGGEIETLNTVLTAVMGDYFLGLKEVWNDESWDNEPAAIEITYKNLFDKIRAEYEFHENDPWFLNGDYLLDGSRLLDGGITFGYVDFKDRIFEAMVQVKSVVNDVKTAGVRVWWREPLEFEHDMSMTSETYLTFVFNTNENNMEMTSDGVMTLKATTDHLPNFLLDGVVTLDGSFLLNGERTIIVSSTELNIITV